MKNLFTLLISLLAFNLFAQLPTDMILSQDREASGIVAGRSSSLAIPYVGAKLGYNIQGNASESILLSGRAMYIPVSGERYAIPFMTNINLNAPDSLSNDAGWSFGVHPFYRLSTDNQLRVFLHGGLIYNILDKKDVDAQSRFRALAGVQLAFYGEQARYPITLSIAPEVIWNTTDVTTRSSGLGLSGVVPIANGLGLLVEGLIPFQDGTKTGLSIGIIVNNELD